MNRKLLWLLASVWAGVIVAGYISGMPSPGDFVEAGIAAQLVTIAATPFVASLSLLDADRASLVAATVTVASGVAYFAVCATIALPVWIGIAVAAMHAPIIGLVAGLSTWTWDYWHRYEVTAS